MPLPFLTEKGLQQASAEIVARARAAQLLGVARDARVLDATCGLGADSCALALAGFNVVSCDIEREALAFARANLEHHDQRARVLCADALAPAVDADVLLLDPDRRAGGRRSLDPSKWSPTLAQALELSKRFAGACLKLAPALDAEVLIDAEAAHLPSDLPRTREWVSRAGELVELCLWTGSVSAGREPRRATRLEQDGQVHRIEGRPIQVEPLVRAAVESIRWLADPDPAVLRSGLLGNLARELQMAPLASKIAYLGGEEPPSSPFLRVWRVLAQAPLDVRHVRAMLAEFDIGAVRVHKRGHSDSPEVLEKRFRGKGSRSGELVVVRLDPGHRAFLVESVAAFRPTESAGLPSDLVGDEGFEPPTSSL